MEKIVTDYKRRTWEIYAKHFKMVNRYVASLSGYNCFYNRVRISLCHAQDIYNDNIKPTLPTIMLPNTSSSSEDITTRPWLKDKMRFEHNVYTVSRDTEGLD